MRLLIRANLKEAVSSLTASMQRSLLALLGISIGIGSVTAMISVGLAVKGEARKQFEALGVDVLAITNVTRSATGSRARAAISIEDAFALETLPLIDAIAPYTVGRGDSSFGGQKGQRMPVIGVTEAFVLLNELPLTDGRFISDLDGRCPFCVIGAETAGALRARAGGRVIGETIRIDGTVYTVVGVLGRVPRRLWSFDANRTAFIPIAAAQRAFGRPGVDAITARMSAGTHHVAATREVKSWFRRKPTPATVRVQSAEALIEQMHKQMRLFTLLLGAMGGISLLAGGIGVMNVMLVSASERRLEIGIRRALGARRMDIQNQFLIESVILSLLGGIVGIAIGIGMTYGICRISGWTFLISTQAMGLGLGVAGAAGIFFGFYPAYQAARLDPVKALRSG